MSLTGIRFRFGGLKSAHKLCGPIAMQEFGVRELVATRIPKG